MTTTHNEDWRRPPTPWEWVALVLILLSFYGGLAVAGRLLWRAVFHP